MVAIARHSEHPEPAEGSTEHVVDVDSRRRISLGRLGHPEHRRYLGRTQPDGTIVLTPAVVVSALEAEVLANPELVERIRQALADGDEVEVDRRERHRPG